MRCSVCGKCFSGIVWGPCGKFCKIQPCFHEMPGNKQVSKEETVSQLMMANDIIEMVWNIKDNR